MPARGGVRREGRASPGPPDASAPRPTAEGGAPTFAEAEALADPTRYRIYRLLLDSDRALPVAEITDVVGVHHTVVRSHLQRLQAVGLVTTETSAPNGRGRPPTLYRATANSPSPGAAAAYLRLSTLLARALQAGVSVRDAGRDTGRLEAAAARAAEPDQDPLTALVHHAQRHGYDPEVDAAHSEVILHRCPYAEVAGSDPQTICSLHLGIAEGIAAELGGIEVLELDARNPDEAGCRLRYGRTHGTPVDPPRSAG